MPQFLNYRPHPTWKNATRFQDIPIPRSHALLDPRLSQITNPRLAADAIALLSLKNPSGNVDSTRITESIQFLGQFGNSGLLDSFTGDNGLWSTVAGGQGAAGAFFSLYFLLNTVWFNRIQRYTARYLSMSNWLASSCLHYMTVLAVGEGFKYKGKTEAADKVIQTWLKKNKWHKKSKRLFREYKIQGEIFIRIFGEPPDCEVRIIDPDFIYSTHEVKDGVGDRHQGIISLDHDSSEVDYYQVHQLPLFDAGTETEDVPAEEMQYRADLMFNERRGRSCFLPVFPQMMQVDQAQTDLMATASVQSKFAFIRKADSPLESIQQMEGQIAAETQQNWANDRPFGYDRQENYPPGAIPTMSSNMTVEKVGADNFAQWIEPMAAAVRAVATQCHLPAEIIWQARDSSDPYSGAIVSNSWQERGVKGEQDDWKQYDLDLISRCTGIDPDDIEVTAPPIAAPDKAAEVQEEDMLIRNKIISRQSVAEKHSLDWEDEKRRMLAEKRELGELFEEPENEVLAEDAPVRNELTNPQ